jgi:hypothetical protein
MKIAFVLVVIASIAVAASAAQVSVRAAPRGLPLDVLHFVEGFVLAVDAKVGNITQCTQNTTITLGAFKVAVDKLTQGTY